MELTDHKPLAPLQSTTQNGVLPPSSWPGMRLATNCLVERGASCHDVAKSGHIERQGEEMP